MNLAAPSMIDPRLPRHTMLLLPDVPPRGDADSQRKAPVAVENVRGSKRFEIVLQRFSHFRVGQPRPRSSPLTSFSNKMTAASGVVRVLILPELPRKEIDFVG